MKKQNIIIEKIFNLNLIILIIIAISTIIESFEDMFSSLSIFSNWMLFLLTMSYINSKMFKLVTYKHQKKQFILILLLLLYFN